MFYAKVKGRGHLSRYVETSRWVGHGNGNSGLPNNNYMETYKLEFKRAINDIKGDYAFTTEADLLERIEKLKLKSKLSDKDMLALDNYTIIEDTAVPAKKRYLVSRHKNKFIGIELGDGAEGYDPDCCTACGYTIAINEPYAKFYGMQMCAHCINEINLQGKEAIANMNNAYATSWLLEKVTAEI